jgi:tRNA A37 threonylcarbamoyladenosine modification protein TsaB
MYLVLDNTAVDEIVVYTSSEDDWQAWRYTGTEEDALLRAIDEALRGRAVTLEAVEGLAIRVGKGRFTATRVAVTVANTLAYARHIPVVAVVDVDFTTIAQTIAETPVGQYAVALYSAEASIGKK